jgi:PTH1 family peptidyl-tRNA hydrolase
MKVVVGLGNPGSRYAATRHNVGFAVVDGLAEAPSFGKFRSQFTAQVGELMEGNEKVLLVKPETFMNLSGRCVRQIVDFYQVPLPDLLVVCDDVNLPLGKLRARARGTHGGHNGLRDIQNHLGTTEYARLRIGVDNPGEREMTDHVLGRFRPGEKSVIEEALGLAIQAVSTWIQQGIEVCMNRYNAGKEKEKKEQDKD